MTHNRLKNLSQCGKERYRSEVVLYRFRRVHLWYRNDLRRFPCLWKCTLNERLIKNGGDWFGKFLEEPVWK